MTRPRWFPKRRRDMSDAEKQIRQQRWRYRAETARTLALPVLVACIIPVIVGMLLLLLDVSTERVNNSRDIKAVLERVERLLEFTDAVQSPEARAAQEAQLQALVDQVDCRNREVVQEVVTGLEDAGVVDPGAIVVTCPGGGS